MESAGWRRLFVAGLSVTLLLAACGSGGGGGGGGSGSHVPGTQPTNSGAGGGAGGDGGGSRSTPARTPLVRALSLYGETTFIRNVTPVPRRALCKISATLYFQDGNSRTISSTRTPGPSNPHEVSWSLDVNPEPVGTRWDMRCTVPDPSQPGGVWIGHGSAALGDFPTPTPAGPSASPDNSPTPTPPGASG